MVSCVGDKLCHRFCLIGGYLNGGAKYLPLVFHDVSLIFVILIIVLSIQQC